MMKNECALCGDRALELTVSQEQINRLSGSFYMLIQIQES